MYSLGGSEEDWPLHNPYFWEGKIDHFKGEFRGQIRASRAGRRKIPQKIMSQLLVAFFSTPSKKQVHVNPRKSMQRPAWCLRSLAKTCVVLAFDQDSIKGFLRSLAKTCVVLAFAVRIRSKGSEENPNKSEKFRSLG